MSLIFKNAINIQPSTGGGIDPGPTPPGGGVKTKVELIQPKYLTFDNLNASATELTVINLDKDSTGNYTEVSDTVVTDFSYKLYKDVGTVEALSYNNYDTEVQFKIKFNAFDNPYYQTIARIEGDNGASVMEWRLAGRTIECLDITNSSDYALGISTQQIPNNTTDWITIKLTYAPTNSSEHRWNCNYSTNGTTFSSAGYLALSRKITNDILNSSIMFFMRSDGSIINGQVDLSQCYIKINGKLIWTGLTGE